MQNPSKNQKKQKSNQVRSHYNNLIQQLYKEEPVDIMTFISSPRYLGASTDDGKGVYPFWKKALIEMFDDNSKIIIVMTGSIAAGKCHQKGTKLLMFDGSIKNVEDLVVGDLLMGPDSKSRTILSLANGRDTMYKVTPKKGDTFVVNKDHVLSLKRTNMGMQHKDRKSGGYMDRKAGKLVNISVVDYLNTSKSFKNLHKLWRIGVEFATQEVPLDPYFLGLWLGDGNSNGPHITTIDSEIKDYIYKIAKLFNLDIRVQPQRKSECKIYCITRGRNGKRVNGVHNILKDLNLINNKHVPDIYKINSRETRLQILAGLIDTDGSYTHNCLEFSNTNLQLCNDVLYIARSLGLAAYLKLRVTTCQTKKVNHSYRILISGETSIIPCKLKRKQCYARKMDKSVLMLGFKVEKLPEDDYYGFTLDNDGLYLMNDFTVTHNTSISMYALCYIQYRLMLLKDPWGFFKLNPSGKMTICFFNLNRTLGDSIGFSRMMSYMSNSPWFRENATSIRTTKKGDVLDFSLIDYALASPWCLSGDTKVPLLDGRTLTMIEIVKEFKEGKEIYTYSYDIDKKLIEPGRITNAFKSYSGASVVAVTLDNGEVIKCTPNHRFLLRDGTYKEAKYLVEGESIMPLYRCFSERGYEKFLHVNKDVWLYTHRRMAGKLPREFRDEKGRFIKWVVVHHKDYNKLNNNPTNLQYMVGSDHTKLHNDNVWKTIQTPEARAKAKITMDKIRVTPEYKKKVSDGVNNSDRWTDEKRDIHSKQVSQRMYDGQAVLMQEKTMTPEALDNKSKSLLAYWASEDGQKRKREQSISMSKEMLDGRSKKMLEAKSAKNPNNHKVVSVVDAGISDVYDLTIDKYSNFALDSGVFVHNSRGFGITGREVVSAILDEVDSPMDPESQKERVVETYSAMFTRFQTRFAPNDYSIGKVFVVCSRQEENSFINTFIAQRQHSGKNDTLIYDPSVWEAKPVGTYSEIKFPVFTGNQYTPPKIIQESEVKQYIDDGHDLIYVPIDFKENFQTNIIRAMRDIAGRSVAGTHKYGLFPSESLISDCFDLTKIDPIPKQTIFTGQKDQLDLIHYINISDIRLPKSTPRYLHYDISFTGDASAVSMCGVKDWKYVDIANPDGTFRQELSPIIETDFCMRIKALDGDRIPPAKVRKLVLDLRQMGFNIAQFSADLQMASEDTLQILRSAGFKAEYISVDKSNKAYFDFRNLVCEKRWVCHKHQMLFFELKNLEVSPLTGKVDHPKKVQDVEFMDTGEANETVAEGSKDLSDSISASITQCLYANERPMDTQLMTNLLKRGSLAPNINNGTLQQEDINKILPLTTSDGSIITGTVDRSGQVDKIQDIFRRMHSR